MSRDGTPVLHSDCLTEQGRYAWSSGDCHALNVKLHLLTEGFFTGCQKSSIKAAAMQHWSKWLCPGSKSLQNLYKQAWCPMGDLLAGDFTTSPQKNRGSIVHIGGHNTRGSSMHCKPCRPCRQFNNNEAAFLSISELLCTNKTQKMSIVTAAAASNGSRGLGGLGRKKSGSKSKVHWVCENCGESYSQWWGECKNCKEMNTLKQFTEHLSTAGKGGGAAARAVEHLGAGSVMNVVQSKSDGEPNSQKAGGRAWLANVGGGPQRLSDIAKGRSQLHWRLPLYDLLSVFSSPFLNGGWVPRP